MALYLELYTEHDYAGRPSAFLLIDGRLGTETAMERGKREALRRNETGRNYNRVRLVEGAYYGKTAPVTDLEYVQENDHESP